MKIKGSPDKMDPAGHKPEGSNELVGVTHPGRGTASTASNGAWQ